MSESVISNERECFVCGRAEGLHRHHIFEGRGRRAIAEEHGAWVYLCGRHHNLSDAGVHFDKSLDTRLKKEAQESLERVLESRAEFMRLFGRSYL